MSYDSLLNKTCIIQSKANTQTISGQINSAWSNLYTGIACRKVMNREPKIFDNDSKVYVDDYKIYFKIGQAIEINNRIIIDNLTYEVLSVGTDSAEHHIKVFAKLLKK